jgi:tetratricopeptide (TPR) repeat protein
MALNPDERQPSAGALVAELERGLAEKREPTTPTRPVAPSLADVRPPPRREGGRAPAIAALIAMLAVAAGIVALSIGGGDGKESASKPPARKQSADKAAPKPAAQQPRRGQVDQPLDGRGGNQAGAASGPQLNDQGFALMRQGRYQEAIPVLERAVKAFPAGGQDTTYAYALYNLGASLRRAGRAGEAIPILERRLQIPNQTDVVQRELDRARREAAKG